jgi:DNA-binding NarL/FixJ family response regulator
MNISDEFHSHDQLMELQRENLQLKNIMKLQRLTKKEKAVLVMIAKGQTDHEISSQLRMSQHTARTHHKNILEKLEKHKTAELAVFASECGLL